MISEKELSAFIAAVLKGAGNSSRTKLLFVDNLIYQAFANLRSNKRIITQTEKDYQGWKLDFEKFESMGTKILIYRHDAFNSWGMMVERSCWMLVILTNTYSVYGAETSLTLRIS